MERFVVLLLFASWCGGQQLSGRSRVMDLDLDTAAPALALTSPGPVTRRVGQDALLTCVVRRQMRQDYTVLWRRVRRDRQPASLLTAGTARVAPDPRLSVLHEPGGSVYVLRIANLTSHDSGLYSCELNTEPVTSLLHQLVVLPPATPSAPPSPALSPDMDRYINNTKERFASCCAAQNVSAECQAHYCDLRLLLSGAPGPGACPVEQLTTVSGCLTDGRNHLPCCLDSGVPDRCAGLCLGQAVQPFCGFYAGRILSCVALGLHTIPRPPHSPAAAAINSTAMLVTWSPPPGSQHLLDHFKINITFLT